MVKNTITENSIKESKKNLNFNNLNISNKNEDQCNNLYTIGKERMWLIY